MHQTSRRTPGVQNWYLFFFQDHVLLDSSEQNSFTELILVLQLTRYVSYVPNGFSQVKVLQAGANTIFRQDKVTMLLETVGSTIKPIDQPWELVLQRDTNRNKNCLAVSSADTVGKIALDLISFGIYGK